MHIRARLAALSLTVTAVVSLAAAAEPDIRSAIRTAPPLPPAPLPTALTADKPLRQTATASGDAVELTIRTALLRPAFGALKAEAGRQLLVLNGEFQNVIPMKAVQAGQKTTEYKIPNLSDHLYVVVNGLEVGRLVARDNSVAGHVPIKDFALARVGDVQRGNMIFAIAAGPVRSLEVRYYDPESSNLVLPLVAPAEPTPEVATAKDKPISSPASNGVIEAAVYGMTRLPYLDGKPASEGTEFVSIDLRARSAATLPATKNGEKPRPTVADWADALNYVSLLVDNEYAAVPVVTPQTTLGASPRLLPDVFTGGRVVFRVPAKAKSLELQCVFPKASVGGRLVTPRPLEMAVQGSRPGKVEIKPVVPPTMDDPFFTAITKIETPAAFAGQPAGDGKQWLVLNVTVANTGKTGEYYQPREQLKFLTSNGEQQLMDAAAADAPRAPADPLWVPADARRSFQAVYRVSATEAALRLAYSGVTKGDVITLPGGTGQGAIQSAKAPSTAPAVAGVDRTDEQASPARPKKPLAADQPLVHDQKNFPSRVAARQSLAPKGIAGVGLTPEQINAAIDRGAAALWKRIADRLKKYDRSRLGDEPEDLIASLALVHANWHKKEPAFDAALRDMLARYDPKLHYQTYQNGIACMIIESYGDTTYVPQLAATTQWLVDQQGPAGTWDYGRYLSRDEEAAAAAAGPRKVLSVVGGRPPEESARGTQAINRRTASIDYTDGDNSVSQYAILGLHSAARSGFELPRDAITQFLSETRGRQNEDGGWAYHGTGSSYGSMTCAGICAVALARFELGEKEPWKDEAVERGLAWLNAYFRVDNHPESPGNWVFYYLYSLERVGRILDTEFIGDHEWYPLGARWLVDQQKPTGLWFSDGGSENEGSAEIPTSFALLFLTRATASLGERVIPQGPGTLKTAALLPPGNRLYVILDCSGSMLEEMDGKVKFDIAKDAVRSLIKDMPDNSDVALRAYGYRLRAIQPGASEDTKLLVPLKTIDRKEMAGFIDGLRCRGKTPMALSLEEAASDLKGAVTPEKPITAVLLTDGGEDSQPRKDPIKAAAEFAKLENVSLRIVGFDINRDDWSQQLVGMADAAHARYLPAAKADELQRELRSAVFGTPETCEVLDAAGKPIRTVQFGEALKLEPGKYQFQTAFAGQTFTESFYISPGETTAITFDAGAIAAEANAAKSAAAKAAEPPAATPPPAEKPAARFCKNCGFPLKPGAKFCTHCGTKVGD